MLNYQRVPIPWNDIDVLFPLVGSLIAGLAHEQQVMNDRWYSSHRPLCFSQKNIVDEICLVWWYDKSSLGMGHWIIVYWYPDAPDGAEMFAYKT